MTDGIKEKFAGQGSLPLNMDELKPIRLPYATARLIEKLEALGNKFDSTMLADCITEQIIDNCDRVFGEDKTTQLLEELDSERYEILKKKRAHNETLISKQEAPPTIG